MEMNPVELPGLLYPASHPHRIFRSQPQSCQEMQSLPVEEMRQYEREFAKLSPAVKEATMEMISSFRREGREEGRQAGKEELVVR